MELERRAAMAGQQRHSRPGTARLGSVREGEWRGRVERLLAKQKGRGRARQKGVEVARTRRVRRRGGVLAERQHWPAQGCKEEGWGRRSVVAAAGGVALKV